MGKELYNCSSKAKELFDKANEILSFRITDIMFDGTEELKQTRVTQPAVFLHSVISAFCMEPARQELAEAIERTEFRVPVCPVYQNVDGLPHSDPAEIKGNLLRQLTASVRWCEEVRNMIADGAEEFVECGPGSVLTGLIGKIRGSLG